MVRTREMFPEYKKTLLSIGISLPSIMRENSSPEVTSTSQLRFSNSPMLVGRIP